MYTITKELECGRENNKKSSQQPGYSYVCTRNSNTSSGNMHSATSMNDATTDRMKAQSWEAKPTHAINLDAENIKSFNQSTMHVSMQTKNSQPKNQPAIEEVRTYVRIAS